MNQIILNGSKFNCVVTREEIKQRYDELAQQISNDFPDAMPNPPIIMGIITGGLYTMIDITRALSKINFPYKVDTLGVSRYTKDEEPGRITITKNPSGYITGKHIIIAEDVIDEGVTITYIKNLLQINNPASIKFLTLGWKKSVSKIDFEIDYMGFELAPAWLIGEGMDNNQNARGLKGIWQKI